MPEVHPAFDATTQTWFVTKPRAEAKSIAALLEQLGPGYTAKGYNPLGVAVPLVLREPQRHPVDNTVRPPTRQASPPPWIPAARPPLRPAAKMITIPPKPGSDATPEQVAAYKKAKKSQYNRVSRDRRLGRLTTEVPTEINGIGVGKPLREATAEERAKWGEAENLVLDMWAAGEPTDVIAGRVQRRARYITGYVLWRARRAGDPRAVIRNPVKIVAERERHASKSGRAPAGRT